MAGDRPLDRATCPHAVTYGVLASGHHRLARGVTSGCLSRLSTGSEKLFSVLH